MCLCTLPRHQCRTQKLCNFFSRVNTLVSHLRIAHHILTVSQKCISCICVCRSYTWNIIISELFQPLSTSVWNNFISARESLPKIISKLFQRFIALLNIFQVQHLQGRWIIFKQFENSFSGWTKFDIVLLHLLPRFKSVQAITCNVLHTAVKMCLTK